MGMSQRGSVKCRRTVQAHSEMDSSGPTASSAMMMISTITTQRCRVIPCVNPGNMYINKPVAGGRGTRDGIGGNDDGGENMICWTCRSVGPQQQQSTSKKKDMKTERGKDRGQTSMV
jgi:hypothetical protein